MEMSAVSFISATATNSTMRGFRDRADSGATATNAAMLQGNTVGGGGGGTYDVIKQTIDTHAHLLLTLYSPITLYPPITLLTH